MSKRSTLIFVTGTDTSVGKTVVTAYLVRCLRNMGVRALAMKPFCSGGRDDAVQLVRAQAHDLTLDQCNPFYYDAPLAPAVAARLQRKRVSMEEVLSRIQEVHRQSDLLVVEGAGGVLVPLATGFTVLDLMYALGIDMVLVVAANRLGTINHTMLTCGAITGKLSGGTRVEVILNQCQHQADEAGRWNEKTLCNALPGIGITTMPFVGENPFEEMAIERVEKKVKKGLARILDSAIFAARQTRRVKKITKPVDKNVGQSIR